MKKVRKKTRKTNNPNGRPPKIDEKEKTKIIELAKLGLTDAQTAAALGFTVRALDYVKARDPKFFQALREAKVISDDRVEKCLYERAVGYEHPEEKVFCTKLGDIITHDTIKHYPPDVAAISLWLTNRKPKEWKVKHEHDLGDDVNRAAASISSFFRREGEGEAARIAAGEDPALVLLGRTNRGPGDAKSGKRS